MASGSREWVLKKKAVKMIVSVLEGLLFLFHHLHVNKTISNVFFIDFWSNVSIKLKMSLMLSEYT